MSSTDKNWQRYRSNLDFDPVTTSTE